MRAILKFRLTDELGELRDSKNSLNSFKMRIKVNSLNNNEEEKKGER